jgi:hypothetical protein
VILSALIGIATSSSLTRRLFVYLVVTGLAISSLLAFLTYLFQHVQHFGLERLD